jgi:hypothetical protein
MKICISIAIAALFFIACSSSSNSGSSKVNPKKTNYMETIPSKANASQRENPSKKEEALYIPLDMPDICQNIDFSTNKDKQKECGVKPINQQAYQNAPKQRYLVDPKQASLVKTGDEIEIRFPNTSPLSLDATLLYGVEFDESKRLSKIENTMDYREFFTEKKERLKLFKLKIPSDTKPIVENEICFKVPELKGSNRTSSDATTVKMELLTCNSFNKFIKKYAK